MCMMDSCDFTMYSVLLVTSGAGAHATESGAVLLFVFLTIEIEHAQLHLDSLILQQAQESQSQDTAKKMVMLT